MAKAKPAEIDQIKQLVAAASRCPIWHAAIRSRSWCAPSGPRRSPCPASGKPHGSPLIVRNVVALLAVLLTLLLGVRPLIKALKREAALPWRPLPELMPPPLAKMARPRTSTKAATSARTPQRRRRKKVPRIEPIIDPETGEIDPAALSRQVGMAQRIVVEQPDNAIDALRQLLKEPNAEPTA